MAIGPSAAIRPNWKRYQVFYAALPTPGMMKIERCFGISWDSEAVSGQRPFDQWSLEPACQSGLDVTPYPVLLPPTVGEHVEQTVSFATSSGAGLRRNLPWLGAVKK